MTIYRGDQDVCKIMTMGMLELANSRFMGTSTMRFFDGLALLLLIFYIPCRCRER